MAGLFLLHYMWLAIQHTANTIKYWYNVDLLNLWFQWFLSFLWDPMYPLDPL